MFKKVAIILNVLLISCQLYAQNGTILPPSGLMCDLVASTNYQSINGYAIPASQLNLANKNVQSVLISNKNPAFSWELNSTGNDVLQTAYQVLIADNIQLLNKNNGNLWFNAKVCPARC